MDSSTFLKSALVAAVSAFTSFDALREASMIGCENARNSVRDTIAWLAADHGLSREDAYILCSLAGDLRISQIVDQPNFGVSFYLPLSVFH